MAQNEILKMLRIALATVPGYSSLPNFTFPSLPILEATEFGQQRIVTTFSLGLPPPAALEPCSEASLAVSLHLILPEGYSYWQPETGTGHYIGGVLEITQLPTMHLGVVKQRTKELSAPSTDGHYPPVQLTQYLTLLEQIAQNGWLLNKNQSPALEKEAALQMQRHLGHLAAPDSDAYYRTRGQVLYSWIERSTYERNWVEIAIDAMRDALPVWIKAAQDDAFELSATPAIPAILDGRQCIITAFYQVSKSTGKTGSLVYPPFGVCYISYPDMETVWQSIQTTSQTALFTAFCDENGRPYLGEKKADFDGSPMDEISQSYERWVSILLKERWLMTRHAVTEEEQNAAYSLHKCIGILYSLPLLNYYRHNAWQLLGWIRRVINEV